MSKQSTSSKWYLSIFIIGFALSVVIAKPGKQQLILQYKEYGEFNPTRTQEVIDAYTALNNQPAPEYDLKIYDTSIPAGITMNGSTISVDEGAPFVIVGNLSLQSGRKGFGYDPDFAMTRIQMRDELIKIGKILDADIMCITIPLIYGDKVAMVNALVVRRTDKTVKNESTAVE